MGKPVFISLVGNDKGTDTLYKRLETKLPQAFPGLNCAFLGDPFEEYPNLRIANKRKREYTPGARMFFRWGFFYEFNSIIVKNVFDDGADIVVVRKFGFDLYAGAIAFQDCDRSLAMHHALIPHGIIQFGIIPPLYVFTEKIGEKTKEAHKRYFAVEGQESTKINPRSPLPKKADSIIGIVRERLQQRRT